MPTPEEQKRLNEELFQASHDGDVVKITSLIKQGANFNSHNDFGTTPAHEAARKVIAP